MLALLRVPRLVLAINKIDLVDYDEETLTAIAKDFAALARSLGFPDDAVVAIPVSALVGDNVVERSERTPWYDGPTLLGHLESVPVVGPELRAPFRMPVQYVIRPQGARAATSSTTTAATPARSPRAPWRRATRSSCCPAGGAPRWRRSTPRTGRWTSPARAGA